MWSPRSATSVHRDWEGDSDPLASPWTAVAFSKAVDTQLFHWRCRGRTIMILDNSQVWITEQNLLCDDTERLHFSFTLQFAYTGEKNTVIWPHFVPLHDKCQRWSGLSSAEMANSVGANRFYLSPATSPAKSNFVARDILCVKRAAELTEHRAHMKV